MANDAKQISVTKINKACWMISLRNLTKLANQKTHQINLLNVTC